MIKVTIDWWKMKTLAKENGENYTFLKSVSKTEIPTLEDILVDKGYANFEGLVNNIEDLPDWMHPISQYEVLRPMKLMRENGLRVTKENVAEVFTCTQVHLPGNELLRVRKLEVREDACTDEIQGLLDEGWQIVAVCPQPSRRPDYIMGRL